MIHPNYDIQPSSQFPSASEFNSIQLSWTLPPHRHTLDHSQEVIWASPTSVDEVWFYRPARFIAETDVGRSVLDIAVQKGFAGIVVGRERGSIEVGNVP